MTTSFKVFLALALFIATIPFLNAQSDSRSKKTSISLETDPSTFAFGGYALHVRVNPNNNQHWLIGAGTYALDMPEALVNLNSANKDKGWKARINSAYALFGEYYFREANHKWFAGMQVGVQNFKITNENAVNQHANYSNLLLMPSLGYTWRPFKFPLYFKPWIGLGYTSKVAGSNVLNGATYNIAPVVPFVTMHAGYTF